MSDYFDSRRKESVSLLFSKSRSITTYDVNFEDILETHRVIKTDNEELNN